MRGGAMAAGFPFGGLVLATAWWFVLFSPWTAPVVRFWWAMLFATGSLLAYSAWLLRRQWHTVLQLNWRNVLLGVTSAIVLYGIFWLGHTVLLLLAPESQDAIAAVYQRRQEAPPWLLALLLGLWIGPAEEIFWRGVLQRALQQRIHRIAALVLATALYSLVHAWSGNLPLLLAAFVAGLFWGGLFIWTGSLVPGIISHGLWDILVFVVAPFQ
jgi:membrane protease YdiL (CAAX protease family)